MSNPKMAEGKCLCGSVKVKFPFANEYFDACHCGMCRKWGGGPLLTVDGKGNGEGVKLEGEQFITTYASSEWAERGFCGNCGTHIFYRLKETGFMNFSLGLIDNADHLKFHLQIFIDKKPDQYDFANKTEKMTEAQVFAKYLPQV